MNRPTTLMRLWRRGQHGWPPSFPIAQVPNAPLLVAMGGWLTAAVSDGAVHSTSRAVFHAGLAAWAWGELAAGANWFRRALGVAASAYVIGALASALAPDA